MEQSTSPGFARLMRHAAIFGSITAAAAFVWLLLEFALGFHGERLESRQYTAMVGLAFPIAGIALGIMRWRDRDLGGRIRFSQAFGVGLGIGLLFAVDYAIFSWLYAAVINPDFIERLISQQAKVMAQSGQSPEEVETAVALARGNATAATYAFAVFVQMLLASFIIALFASVVVRRKS